MTWRKVTELGKSASCFTSGMLDEWDMWSWLWTLNSQWRILWQLKKQRGITVEDTVNSTKIKIRKRESSFQSSGLEILDWRRRDAKIEIRQQIGGFSTATSDKSRLEVSARRLTMTGKSVFLWKPMQCMRITRQMDAFIQSVPSDIFLLFYHVCAVRSETKISVKCDIIHSSGSWLLWASC